MTKKPDDETEDSTENLSQRDTRESRCDQVLVTVDAESFDDYSRLLDAPPSGAADERAVTLAGFIAVTERASGPAARRILANLDAWPQPTIHSCAMIVS